MNKHFKTDSDTEYEVEKYLQVNSIKYSCIFNNLNLDDDFNGFKFGVKLNDEGFKFTNGIGHTMPRKDINNLQKRDIELNYNQFISINALGQNNQHTLFGKGMRRGSTLHERDVFIANSFISAPSAASVLFCLFMDSEAATVSFAEWCDTFGYSSDSIKHRRMYFECQETEGKLNKVLNSEQKESLRELLEDY